MLLPPYSTWLERSPTKSTRRIYRQTLGKWIAFWGDRPARDVIEGDLVAFRDRLSAEKLAPATVAGHMSRLKAFFHWVHQEGIEPIAPAVLRFRHRGEQVAASKRYLKPEHAIAVVDAAEEGRDRLLLKCLLRLGVRNAEVRSLTWGDLHYERLSVRGKGNKVRSIRIDGELLKELQVYRGERGDREPMFPSKSGRHLSGIDISRIVSVAVRRARQSDPSIPPNVTPHWFRHSIATMAIAAGRNVREVQQHLGHASAKTTLDIYAHAVSDRPLWE